MEFLKGSHVLEILKRYPGAGVKRQSNNKSASLISHATVTKASRDKKASCRLSSINLRIKLMWRDQGHSADSYYGKPVVLKYVKFQNVQSLTIFIEDNHSDSKTTKVQKIGLYRQLGASSMGITMAVCSLYSLSLQVQLERSSSTEPLSRVLWLIYSLVIDAQGMAALMGVLPPFVPFARAFTAALTGSLYYIAASPKDPTYVVAPILHSRSDRQDLNKLFAGAWPSWKYFGQDGPKHFGTHVYSPRFVYRSQLYLNNINLSYT